MYNVSLFARILSSVLFVIAQCFLAMPLACGSFVTVRCIQCFLAMPLACGNFVTDD